MKSMNHEGTKNAKRTTIVIFHFVPFVASW